MTSLKKWLKQRRNEKKLALKYARQSTRIQNIELNLAVIDLAMMRERMCLDMDFQKRKGMRDYIK